MCIEIKKNRTMREYKANLFTGEYSLYKGVFRKKKRRKYGNFLRLFKSIKHTFRHICLLAHLSDLMVVLLKEMKLFFK